MEITINNNTDFIFFYNICNNNLKVIAKESCERQPFSSVKTFLFIIFIVEVVCVDCPVICNMDLWSVVSQGFTSSGNACNTLAQHCSPLFLADFF